MRVLTKTLLVLAIVGLAFTTACDIIDAPRREGGGEAGDFVCIDGPGVSTERTVLMEEFTGMKCGNCPPRSKEAQAFVEQYNGRFILNSIHSGGFAEPDGGGLYTPDLRTATGDQLDLDFQLQSYPNAVINRSSYDGTLVLGATDWQAKVEEELQKNLAVKLCVVAGYDTESDIVSTTVNLEYQTDGDLEDFVSVYLVADTVDGPQKWYNHDPENLESYPHVNLMRGSFNGVYGTRVSDTTIVPGDRFALKFERPLSAFNRTLAGDWQRLKVLAFVHNNTTGEIKQAEEVYISQQ